LGFESSPLTIASLEHIEKAAGHRAPAMVTYRLDEYLLSPLAGILWAGNDWELIALLSHEYRPWLKQFLSVKHTVPQAQTFREIIWLLKVNVLEERFVACRASLQDIVCGAVAIDGKTLCGAKKSAHVQTPVVPGETSHWAGVQ
jgi:hypothetical protein